METRQFGTTDMRVGVLGFGGAEIGFEKAAAEASPACSRTRSTPGSTSSTPPSATSRARS